MTMMMNSVQNRECKGSCVKLLFFIGMMIAPLPMMAQQSLASGLGSIAPSTSAELTPGDSNLSNLAPLLETNSDNGLTADGSGASVLRNTISLSPVMSSAESSLQRLNNGGGASRNTLFGASTAGWQPAAQTGSMNISGFSAPGTGHNHEGLSSQSQLARRGIQSGQLSKSEAAALENASSANGVMNGSSANSAMGNSLQNISAQGDKTLLSAGGKPRMIRSSGGANAPAGLNPGNFPDSTRGRGWLNPTFAANSLSFSVGGGLDTGFDDLSTKTFLEPKLGSGLGMSGVSGKASMRKTLRAAFENHQTAGLHRKSLSPMTAKRVNLMLEENPRLKNQYALRKKLSQNGLRPHRIEDTLR